MKIHIYEIFAKIMTFAFITRASDQGFEAALAVITYICKSKINYYYDEENYRNSGLHQKTTRWRACCRHCAWKRPGKFHKRNQDRKRNSLRRHSQFPGKYGGRS